MDRFEELVYAPVRRTVGEVSFVLAPPGIKENALITTAEEAVFSRVGQTLDNVDELTAKIATFEPEHWRLDGSFILPVHRNDSHVQTGWWSEQVSNEQGEFWGLPFIQITFDEPVNIPSVGIMFDRLGGDWATRFEIRAFDCDGRLFYLHNAEGNDGAYYSTDELVVGVHIIRFVFFATNRPFRMVRVAEFNFGKVITFNGDDIMDLRLITEGDPKAGSFPLPSFDLSIANKGRFDQMEPDSLAQHLYKRQAFEYRHGVFSPSDVQDAPPGAGTTEWVNCGVYYLNNWSVTDEVVRFKAVGRANVFENMTFFGSAFAKKSIGNVIKDFLDGAGFTCFVPPMLFNAPVVSSFFGNVSYRQVLGYLAELSCCMAHEDRQNIITFTDVLENREHVDVIDYNQSFGAPKVTFETYYNGINLTVSRISAVHGQLAQVSADVEGERDVVVYFTGPLLKGGEATVSEGFSLSDISYNTMFMTARLTGNGTAEITVMGEGVEFSNEEIFYAAPWKDPFEGELPYTVKLPMMIDDGTAQFETFRQWFLTRKFELLNRRLTCEVSWRQNPKREVGDKLLVQVNRQNARVPLCAARQAIEFKGGVLRGKTTAVGVGGL